MLYIEQLEEEIKEEQQNSDKQPKTMNELYNLPGKREGFDGIAFLVFNCLGSFLMMLEDDELHCQPKPIEEDSDLDNEANKTLAYDELVKK